MQRYTVTSNCNNRPSDRTLKNCTMIAVLLIAFLIGQHKQVRSDPIEAIQELDQRAAQLVANFNDTLRKIFHAELRDAEADNNHPLNALLVEVIKMELSQHEYEKESLYIAKGIIQRYFDSSQLGHQQRWPPETASLIDLIIKRVIQRTCENQQNVDLMSRKRIYLSLRSYSHRPGIKEATAKQAQRMRNRKFRALRARAIMEEALERYKQVAHFANADQQSQILDVIDGLIEESRSHKSSFIDPHGSNEDLRMDLVAHERFLVGRVVRPRESTVNNVTIDDLEHSENLLIETHLRAVLSKIRHRQDMLRKKFAQNIDKIFHEQQQVAEATRNYPLMLLSARMAECEAIMYTAEYRMLIMLIELIRRLFIDMSEPLNETLIQNSNLLDMVIERATGYAIEAALRELTGHRKSIYLSLLGYDYGQFKEVAREFYQILNDRKAQMAKADEDSLKSLKRYRNEVSLVLPDPQMTLNTLKAIDQLVDNCVKADNIHIMRTHPQLPPSKKDRNYLLKRFVGTSLMDKIRSAEEMTTGKVAPEPGPGWIDSFGIQQVEEYENRSS